MSGKEGVSTPIRALEWVTLAASAALILAVAGYLAARWMGDGARPGTAAVRPLLDAVEERGNEFVLPVEVVNRGGRTLSRLRLAVRYREGEGTGVRRHRIEYLPPEVRTVVFVPLPRDPRGLGVEAAVESYEEE